MEYLRIKILGKPEESNKLRQRCDGWYENKLYLVSPDLDVCHSNRGPQCYGGHRYYEFTILYHFKGKPDRKHTRSYSNLKLYEE